MLNFAILCVIGIAVDGAIPPSIETDSNGNVIVTMPKGAHLRVVTLDEDGVRESGTGSSNHFVGQNSPDTAGQCLRAPAAQTLSSSIG